MAAALPTAGLRSAFAASPQSSRVFDAMGEIREVYDRALLEEMLDSCLNAITKTMCDPKIVGLVGEGLSQYPIEDIVGGNVRRVYQETMG